MSEPRRTAIGLMCVAFVVYNANCRVISAGDCLPARFLPVSVLLEGTVRLDSVYEATRIGRPDPYWIKQSVDGHFVSMYPIVLPLLVTPLYAPGVVVWKLAGGGERRLELMGEVMEKVSASIVASISVGLCYLLLRRWLRPRDAVLLALAYAFGTNTWMTGSQALWQHGAGELFLLAALLSVTSAPSLGAAVLTGVFCGLLPANRPPDVFLALGIFSFVMLFWSRRNTWTVALSGIATVLPFRLYNWITFRNWAGGYGLYVGHSPSRMASYFQKPLLTGIAALLVSPGKGLLVYAPFLVFLGLATTRLFAARKDRILAFCLAASAALQLLLYARFDWTGGVSYGPRFLTDLVPILVFLLIPVMTGLSSPGRLVLVALVAASVCIQAIGAFCYLRGGSDLALEPWNPSRSPILVEARAGLMPFTFVTYAKKLLGGRLAPVQESEPPPVR